MTIKSAKQCSNARKVGSLGD